MIEISKAYEPHSVEDKWYDFWKERCCFLAGSAGVSEKCPKNPIAIPPSTAFESSRARCYP